MIRHVQADDRAALEQFFRLMIEDTFEKEGVGHLKDEIRHEEKEKMTFFDRSLTGKDRFYILIEDEQIIGTASLIPATHLITEHAPKCKDLIELSSLFIHKDYQDQGRGSQMIDYLLKTLKAEGIESFCLDSGYRLAQKKWCRKFGDPYRIVKDLWGPSFDHYIWLVKL